MRRRERSARAGGFTLIEIVAVLAILLLIALVVIPRATSVSSGALLDDGKKLAATIDFARGRAVGTGRPHRVVLDLDAASYRIEALPPRLSPIPIVSWSKLDELPLIAPRSEAETQFAPLTGSTGDETRLQAAVRFAGVESDAGVVSEGVTALEFQSDGATPATLVWLEASNAQQVRVDVAALADPTRVAFDAQR